MRPASTSAATSHPLALTAWPRRCGPNITRNSTTCSRQPVSRPTTRPATPATVRRATSITSTSTTHRATEMDTDQRALTGLRESATFDRPTIAAIQRAAETGIYDIRGWGAKRPLPHFDDLLFLGASMSRYPLEGYRARCGTDVVLGDRFAQHPLHLH